MQKEREISARPYATFFDGANKRYKSMAEVVRSFGLEPRAPTSAPRYATRPVVPGIAPTRSRSRSEAGGRAPSSTGSAGDARVLAAERDRSDTVVGSDAAVAAAATATATATATAAAAAAAATASATAAAAASTATDTDTDTINAAASTAAAPEGEPHAALLPVRRRSSRGR